MRLFVALDIDEAIQQRLDDYVRTLQPRVPAIRFVKSSNYHVTLKFLGEVRSSEPVIDALRKVHSPEFTIRFEGVGFFPNPRSPRIFWAGMHAPPELSALARRVNDALQGFGFKEEDAFRPHLTLARSGSGRPKPFHGERGRPAFAQLAQLVASSPAPEFGTMSAREFFLYESKLSSVGATYHKLERFELAG